MALESIIAITFILIAISVAYYFRRNDEFALLIVLFFVATGLNRYLTVVSGENEWVNVKYAYSIFYFDDVLALEALNLFLLGTGVFVLCYIMFNKTKPASPIAEDSYFSLSSFLHQKKKFILYLFVAFIFINSIATGALGAAENIAYGNSYAFLFRLALGGIILLAFMVYKNMRFGNQFFMKSIMSAVLIFSAYISYNPGLRFQFLSWMIALAILYLKDASPAKKIRSYALGGFAVLLFFSLAGVARYQNVNHLTWEEKYELAMERASTTEDQNMLDGFMMVLQVYPEQLDFHYGLEHLEIFVRPIPRSLWPEKPVGGYANKLGLNEGTFQGTVGISQSIYGTFYGEGGIIGIILFSILYAIIFIWLFRYANRYQSDIRYLLKGIIIASAVPILRGGDIPGIIAFIGMSYWPVFLVLYQYGKFLKSLKRRHLPREIPANFQPFIFKSKTT